MFLKVLNTTITPSAVPTEEDSHINEWVIYEDISEVRFQNGAEYFNNQKQYEEWFNQTFPFDRPVAIPEDTLTQLGAPTVATTCIYVHGSPAELMQKYGAASVGYINFKQGNAYIQICLAGKAYLCNDKGETIQKIEY